MAETIKLPSEVIDLDWKHSFQLVGKSESGERNYKNENAVLVDKNEVKNATTRYKGRKIGQTAILSFKDELAA